MMFIRGAFVAALIYVYYVKKNLNKPVKYDSQIAEAAIPRPQQEAASSSKTTLVEGSPAFFTATNFYFSLNFYLKILQSTQLLQNFFIMLLLCPIKFMRVN